MKEPASYKCKTLECTQEKMLFLQYTRNNLFTHENMVVYTVIHVSKIYPINYSSCLTHNLTLLFLY